MKVVSFHGIVYNVSKLYEAVRGPGLQHPALCTAYLECCGDSCCDNIFPQCVVESIIVTRGGQGRSSPPLPSAKKGQLLLLSLLPQSKVVHPRVQPALGSTAVSCILAGRSTLRSFSGVCGETTVHRSVDTLCPAASHTSLIKTSHIRRTIEHH